MTDRQRTGDPLVHMLDMFRLHGRLDAEETNALQRAHFASIPIDADQLVAAIEAVDAEQAEGEVFATERSERDPSGYWHRVADVYAGEKP